MIRTSNPKNRTYRAEYAATRELVAQAFAHDTAGLNSYTLGLVEGVMNSPTYTPAARVQAVAAVLDATQDHADALGRSQRENLR